MSTLLRSSLVERLLSQTSTNKICGNDYCKVSRCETNKMKKRAALAIFSHMVSSRSLDINTSLFLFINT